MKIIVKIFGIICAVTCVTLSILWIVSYWRVLSLDLPTDRYALIYAGSVRIIRNADPPQRIMVRLWTPVVASGCVAALLLLLHHKKQTRGFEVDNGSI